jgi:hypothetical protein
MLPGLKKAWSNEFKSEIVCSGRRISFSKKGYMGMVPAQTREDDLICVILGLNSPVVL